MSWPYQGCHVLFSHKMVTHGMPAGSSEALASIWAWTMRMSQSRLKANPLLAAQTDPRWVIEASN